MPKALRPVRDVDPGSGRDACPACRGGVLIQNRASMILTNDRQLFVSVLKRLNQKLGDELSRLTTSELCLVHTGVQCFETCATGNTKVLKEDGGYFIVVVDEHSGSYQIKRALSSRPGIKRNPEKYYFKHK